MRVCQAASVASLAPVGLTFGYLTVRPESSLAIANKACVVVSVLLTVAMRPPSTQQAIAETERHARSGASNQYVYAPRPGQHAIKAYRERLGQCRRVQRVHVLGCCYWWRERGRCPDRKCRTRNRVDRIHAELDCRRRTAHRRHVEIQNHTAMVGVGQRYAAGIV